MDQQINYRIAIINYNLLSGVFDKTWREESIDERIDIHTTGLSRKRSLNNRHSHQELGKVKRDCAATTSWQSTTHII